MKTTKRRSRASDTAFLVVGLIWLVASTQGSGCGSCSGGCDVPPPPPLNDAVWCNISAIPCGAVDTNTGVCVAPLCSGGCALQSDGETLVCTNPALCTKKLATLPGGSRLCFNHTQFSPLQICESAGCTNFTTFNKFNLDRNMFPLDLTLGQGCSGLIDFTPGHPYNTTFPGDPQPDYVANGCINDGPAVPGFHPNTNAVTLGGAASVQSTGNGIPPHPMTIKSGHFHVSAPNTTCNALQTDCPVDVTEAEMDFDDLVGDTGSIGGGGTHAMRNASMFLDNPFLTPSGVFLPAGGGLPAAFSFPLPPGVVFDAIGTGDGFLIGTTVTSDQELNATINLETGQIVYDFDLRETVGGNLAELTGTATTATVLEVGPVLTATPPAPATATSSCSANVTLTSTSSSPIGIPVTVDYSVDGTVTRLNAGSSTTVSLPVGTHTVLILATDANGGMARVVTSATVNDGPAPTFDTTPPPVTVSSCSTGSNTVHVTVPTAHDQCTHAAATVTGTVIQLNGATVSIPVTNGTVSLPPGTAVIRWVATNANGTTASVNQTVTVVGPATYYGLHGVNLNDRSTVNGTVYSGGGGTASVGNDSIINGSVISLSPVHLFDRVSATLINTNAGLTRGSNDVIGTILTTTPVLPTFPTITQTFTGTQAVTVAVGATRTLAPGQYGAVTVFSNGKLVLSTGTYAFTSLDLEPQATLVTPSSAAETARVFVRDSVIYRGRTAISSGTLAPLFLGYTGVNGITIESVYSGTIVAPNATLTMQSLNGTGVYTGEFFGKQVVVSPGNTTNSSPFTCH
jgi:hypothetical protein